MVLAALSDDDDAAVATLARAERGLAAIVECGLELTGAGERLDEARVHAEEVARELRELLDGVEENPAELDAVETRLHRLETLMLKYGSPLERVLEHRRKLLDERGELAGVEELLEAAAGVAAVELAVFDGAALALDRGRDESREEKSRKTQPPLGPY